MKYFKKAAISKGLVAASTLILTTSLFAAEKKQEVDFSTTEVSPGLYMLAGVGGFTGGNIGLSVGEDGVVMIDDSMPPLLDKMKKSIKSVTDKPVDFLINTHVHGDHTGNNENMGKEGTRIVAHENLRQHLLTKGIRTQKGNEKAPKAALPVITFSHSMSFHLNGEDAKIFHVAHAHTDGDAVIHFKNANVIHMGDTFFNGMFPFIDLDSGGSVDGFIKAQKKVYKLSNDDTKIIPGHGPLANKKDLKMAIEMLVDVRKIITKLVKQGKSEAEVVKLNPLAKYDAKWTWGFISTERMTKQIYRGVKEGHKHAKEKGHHSH
ncbi:MBL fold metallo-hydrolase [Aliikangiella coralliicola]|uniref:MBL fold metallo-hydrolase n=1 Tax=Aliikangiella coralliicola TaxID=2592383 RepID=A0A545UIK5_9GAMM|nr:MBL fold metallo-hydrolase [Aliikangiella coralliicola]TQV89296.1 MBL fold metallo-hydrolase [Aliikangiella coralliicola]